MKRIVLISLLVFAPLLAGCHTIQGIGKDITSVGNGMEDATH